MKKRAKKLATYAEKRDFSVTSEPPAQVAEGEGRSFVVQKHAARRLHYDFRLELDGVLKSWAVPKGPSLVAGDKRLAVEVEDHPVDYQHFEGTIPKGEYGGGEVIVWDRGRWTPVGDPHEGLRTGHLRFVLEGEKLQGGWSLVRLKPRGRETQTSWLLLKARDEHAREGDEAKITELAPASVVTGRTLEELASAPAPPPVGRSRGRKRASNGKPAGGAEPSFIGAREDKPAEKVVREREEPMEPTKKRRKPAKAVAPEREERGETRRIQGAAARRTRARGAGEEPAVVRGVTISHGDRIIDEASGVTKGELVRYYGEVADALLPYAKGRPLALVRCPAGRDEKCFFQKHLMPGMGKSVRRASVGEHEVLYVSEAAGIIELAQFGVVELHGWGSRLPAADKPDWIVIDLDPDEGLPYERVVEAAFEAREALRSIGLESWVKTTGGKGLHVVAPFRPRYGWDVVKPFARAIADGLARQRPDAYIATLSKAARRGRIFVDYLRNGEGATAVLPYSARARAGVTVAMPIAWDDVRRVHPGDFTVRTAPALLARRRRDPWAEVLTTKQRLPPELEQLVA